MLFNDQQRKIKRSAKLISVLSKHGFKELLQRIAPNQKIESNPSHATQSIYERIRLALQELGPTFVKLGQTFSDREDFLPMELIEELRKLQDKVEVVDLDLNEIFKTELNIQLEDVFESINQTPIAAASIAQVYKGKLRSGEEVIVKVKRPGIENIVKDDLLLLHDFVTLIDTYSEIGDQLNLKYAIAAFEKSILEELSFKNELANINLFEKNFGNHEQTHVPKAYSDLSSDGILTMEFIDGVKITETDKLIANDFDPVRLSEVGYRIYVEQILTYGVFHADPHAGNILVNQKGQLVFIDFGAVGKIPAKERAFFEQLVLNLMSKKPQKIIRNLKEVALHYSIPDDKQFERDVTKIVDYVHGSSLKDIQISDIILQMKDVLKNNRLVMPEYFYLLFKGITLMDSVGRKINPNLDVIASLKPYTDELIRQKLAPENLAKMGWEKANEIFDDLQEVPKELRNIIEQLHEKKLTFQTESKHFNRLDYLIKSSVLNVILTLIICIHLFGAMLLFSFYQLTESSSLLYLSIICLLITFGLTLVLLLRILRR